MCDMPKIDLGAVELSGDEIPIAYKIVNNGKLRASKPKINYSIKEIERSYGNGKIYKSKIRVPDEIGGKAAYVWRMVAFMVSKKRAHQCMPMTADFDLPEDDYQKRRVMAKELDQLVNKIVDSIPKNQWAGVQRWAQVFGVSGAPQVNADGAVVYR